MEDDSSLTEFCKLDSAIDYAFQCLNERDEPTDGDPIGDVYFVSDDYYINVARTYRNIKYLKYYGVYLGRDFDNLNQISKKKFITFSLMKDYVMELLTTHILNNAKIIKIEIIWGDNLVKRFFIK